MKLVVTVDAGDAGQDLKDIRDRLEKGGLKVESVMEAIGVVTGTAQESAIPKLRGIAGVLAVEPDEIVTIDPIEDPRRNR